MPGIAPQIADLATPISELKPYPLNPRRGNTAAIVESLEHHGQYRPIVVNQRTSEVLAGNHTLAAAKQLGWTQIAATFVDVDADQAARIVLVDNRANDLAAYDEPAVAELLKSVPTLAGTGWQESELDDLIDRLAPDDDGPINAGDVPPSEIVTKKLTFNAEQHALVNRALDDAKQSGALNLDVNPNRNGSALAHICEIATTAQGPTE